MNKLCIVMATSCYWINYVLCISQGELFQSPRSLGFRNARTFYASYIGGEHPTLPTLFPRMCYLSGCYKLTSEWIKLLLKKCSLQRSIHLWAMLFLYCKAPKGTTISWPWLNLHDVFVYTPLTCSSFYECRQLHLNMLVMYICIYVWCAST